MEMGDEAASGGFLASKMVQNPSFQGRCNVFGAIFLDEVQSLHASFGLIGP